MRVPFLKTREPQALAQTDVQTVRAKLAACSAEIAQAEQELRRVSLDAALGEDQGAADHALAHLTQLRAKREVLNAALAAAHDAEHKAKQTERDLEFAARRRAASQHIARFEKAARAVSETETALLSHYETMVDAARSLVATLPEHMRSREEPWHEMLSPGELRDATLVEGYRLNLGRRAALFARPPGTSAREDRETGQLSALTDRIAEMTATIRQHFDQAAPPKPQSNPPGTATVLIAPVSDDVFPSSMSSETEQRPPASAASVGEVVDLRGVAKGEASEASIGEAAHV